MNHDESEPDTLEMHYRVTLDFRMLVRPITPEVCQASFFFNTQRPSAAEPDYQENVERSTRWM